MVQVVSADTLKLCEAVVSARRHKLVNYNSSGELLRYLGFGWLGNGWFGEAWSIPNTNLVLKISGPGGWGIDGVLWKDGPEADAWPAYAEHCMLNSYPHLPRVYFLKRVSQRMSWGIMERLKPVPSYDSEDFRSHVRDVLDGRTGNVPEWLRGVRAMRESLNLYSDVHPGNVMLRGSTGDLVLTDPFSTTMNGSEYTGSSRTWRGTYD